LVQHHCRATHPRRDQGKALEHFEQVEKACLKELPDSPYDLAVLKRVKVYRDCYVVFGNAFYSVLERLYPGWVWVCGGSKQVRVFDEKYKLVTTHERASQPGERITNPEHVPPEKLPGLKLSRWRKNHASVSITWEHSNVVR
jgi:hypothetical protein